MSVAPATAPVLQARGLTKHFGTIRAVQDVDLEIRPGEVVAVVGDNGAGKSTLIKMLSGAIPPDLGEIQIEGVPQRLRGPNDARALGIETLYQDLALLPNLDVTTNLYLGREELVPGPANYLGFVARREADRAFLVADVAVADEVAEERAEAFIDEFGDTDRLSPIVHVGSRLRLRVVLGK